MIKLIDFTLIGIKNMFLSHANKAINNIHDHVSRMMRVSSRYGKKMGTMGSLPYKSAHGASFARKTAKMMANPNLGADGLNSMLYAMQRRGTKAGMSEAHLGQLKSIGNDIKAELGGGSNIYRDVMKASFNTPKDERMRTANRIGLL